MEQVSLEKNAIQGLRFTDERKQHDQLGQRFSTFIYNAPIARRPAAQSHWRLADDAVFAFALTLLVVSLQVPKSYEELMNLMIGFPAFACCFGVLLWIWYEHNLFFRRYGLQDPYTVFLNGALLFVVMFYVYPLKFMFDSWFARFLPLPRKDIVPMSLMQLSNASVIYGLGFFLLFVMFALLYWHAYGKREALALKPLEVLDVRAFLGQHIVSAAIGLVAVGVAVFVPKRYGYLSPGTFALMGPAHLFYDSWTRKKRKVFESQLPPEPAAASASQSQTSL